MKYLKLLLLCLLLVACTQPTSIDINDYIGTWAALTVSYGDDVTYEIGYLRLVIEDKKHFNTYDMIGNPGIEGDYVIIDDHTVRIDCTKDTEYDPEWDALDRKTEFNFKIVDNDHLTFSNEVDGKLHTYSFVRDNEEQ